MGSQVMQTTFATDMEAQHPPPSNNRARAVIGGLVTITLAVAAVVALSSGSPTSMTNDAATDAATELNARDCFSMKQYTCPLACCRVNGKLQPMMSSNMCFQGVRANLGTCQIYYRACPICVEPSSSSTELVAPATEDMSTPAAAIPTTENAACDKSFCYSTCPKYSCCANGGKCPGCGSAEARQCFSRCNGCPRAATTELEEAAETPTDQLESPAQLTWQLCPSCSPATMAKAAQGPGGPNGSGFKTALAKCTKYQQAHMKQIIAAGEANAASTELGWCSCYCPGRHHCSPPNVC